MSTPFLILLCLIFSLGSLSATPVSEASKTIIDMHCHIAGVGAGNSGCFVSERMSRSLKFPIYLRSFGVGINRLRKHGDQELAALLAARVQESAGVGKVVVLALDGVVDAQGRLDRERSEIYIPNDFVAKLTKAHPVLLFGASVNPLRSDAIERLERAHKQGAVLVKWLPAIQHFDPSDPRFIPFYRKLVELDMPLLTHAGAEHAFTSEDRRLSDPELLRLPASLGVKLIVAHAATPGRYAGERGIDRLCRLAKDHPTVYADISSLTQLNKRRALSTILARPELRDRLVYGTDFPLIRITGMSSPWYFTSRIGVGRAWTISRIKNPWDRDVALKRAIGVPEEAFHRFESLMPRTTCQHQTPATLSQHP